MWKITVIMKESLKQLLRREKIYEFSDGCINYRQEKLCKTKRSFKDHNLHNEVLESIFCEKIVKDLDLYLYRLETLSTFELNTVCLSFSNHSRLQHVLENDYHYNIGQLSKKK